MNKLNIERPPSSKLRISTMTATCRITSNMNLIVISKYLPIDDNIKYIEYANEPTRGIKVKHISEKKAKKKKIFFNQITILVSVGSSNVNVKLFNNGSISMTGLKSQEDGENAINILLKLLKITKGLINIDKVPTLLDSLETVDCSLLNFNIVLINSDFYAGFEIKRNELHKLLVSEYKIFSSYEPCIYPGVNSKFYWNKEYYYMPFIGKCYCNLLCNGKGRGCGNGDCKKVTIATFQSGSVIITGARNMQQVNDAYSFINSIFNKHYEILKKQNAPFLDFEDSIKKKKTLPKDIICLKRDTISIRYMQK